MYTTRNEPPVDALLSCGVARDVCNRVNAQNEKGQAVHKVVFIIFYRSASLTPKLRRICDAFAANRHEIPEFESRDKVMGMQRELLSQLQDTMQLLKEERNLTFMALRNLAQNIDKWKKGIKR